MSPTALRTCLKRLLERVGEAHTVGGASRRGVWTLLARGRASTFVDDAVVAGLPRPMHLAYVPWDDPTPVGANVVRAGRAMTVRAAVDVRLAGETVARMLVAA